MNQSKTIAELRSYVQKIGYPDEQILGVERIKTSNMGLVIFALIVSVGIIGGFSVAFFLNDFPLGGWLFAALGVFILIIILSASIVGTYLILTDRAVYFCTGAYAETIFTWAFSELAMVECRPRSIRVTSTYSHWEAGTKPIKGAKSWKNFISVVRGKPIERKLYSFTEFFVRPTDSQGYVESSRRLFFIFRLKEGSSMQQLFAKAAKKYPDVKVEFGKGQIE